MSTIGLRFDLSHKTRKPRKLFASEAFRWLRGPEIVKPYTSLPYNPLKYRYDDPFSSPFITALELSETLMTALYL